MQSNSCYICDSMKHYTFTYILLLFLLALISSRSLQENEPASAFMHQDIEKVQPQSASLQIKNSNDVLFSHSPSLKRRQYENVRLYPFRQPNIFLNRPDRYAEVYNTALPKHLEKHIIAPMFFYRI